MRKHLVAATALVLASAGAEAAIVNVNYTSGYHIGPWVTVGGNGASNNVVYGDGANFGVGPQNTCIDGNPVGTQRFCSDYTLSGAINQTVALTVGTGTAVAGGNGGYWSTNATTPNLTPSASYSGTLQFDDSTAILYTDKATGLTDTYYKVTGGSLDWTGTVGFEVLVNASATSGAIGGSFFSYSWTNSSVNLVTGARGAGARCDLGMSGAAVVGAILCGAANPAGGFAYNSVGAYVNGDWALIKDLGNGNYELVLSSNRRTQTGGGNDLQERLCLSTNGGNCAPPVIPVPAAVWLFGSALGLLGVARRKLAA